MGVDFRVDDDPRYRVSGSAKTWRGELRWKEELVGREDLRALFEDPPESLSVRVESVPQEPPLPVGKLNLRPHWAYSGFARFRERVAKTIGVELYMMEGFYSDHRVIRRYFGENVDYSRFSELQAEAAERWKQEVHAWDDVDSDLVPLLDHSDCDGDLSPEDCARVAPALREALRQMEEDRYERFGDGRDRDIENGVLLADMMDVCAEYDRRLVFC